MAQLNEKQAFTQRLRAALKANGVRLSPTVVANEFNLRYWGRSITPHTARNWLLGNALPTQDKLRVLAEWLQVEPQELRFGTTVQSPLLAQDSGVESLNMVDREMLGRYLTLPPLVRKTVREVVGAFTAASSVQATAIQTKPTDDHSAV